MWDERYNTSDYVFGEAPCRWLVMNRDRLPATGTALAIGDGEGRNGVYLAEQGLNVTSVDLSAVGLAKARQLATRRGVELTTIQADLAHFRPKPESVSVVAAIYTHLPSPIREQVHQSCAEALEPGGVFILEAFHLRQLGRASGGPKTPDLLYQLDALLDDLKTLSVVEAYEGVCHLDEGPRHQGLGDIVRLLLQKPL